MPTLRRRTLPLALVLCILTAIAAAVFIRQALACPIEIPPQPLRTLYKFSDRIIVARVGHTEVVEVEEHVSHVRTALYVTENVKGEGDALVWFYHWVSPEDVGAAESNPDESESDVSLASTDGRAVPRYKQGDRLLVFLEKRKEGGYEVDNEGYGVKKLLDDDLKIYLERIKELSDITRREPPDKAALAEWLVRCAEEPATRWEGAYELMLSADALEREGRKQETPPAEATGGADASALDVASTAPVPMESVRGEESGDALDLSPVAVADGGGTTDAPAPPLMQFNSETAQFRLPVTLRRAPRDPSLAAALSEDQKRRLADALFSAEKIEEGEGALLQVVKNFGDARFAPFLVAQLRRVEDNPPYQVEEWLTILANAMKSEEAVELTGKYSENVTYYEEERAVESDVEEAEEEEIVDQKELDAREAAGNERARKKRSDMLKELLTRVERIAASAELARQ